MSYEFLSFEVEETGDLVIECNTREHFVDVVERLESLGLPYDDLSAPQITVASSEDHTAILEYLTQNYP